jgi:hypothetical protein
MISPKKTYSKQYLKPKDLYIEIIVSKEMGKLTKDAEKYLNILGKNIMKKFYYNNNDDKLDCYQNGMYQIYKNWHMFDEMKGDNPFAYYTEIFKRGVAAGWKEVNKGRKECISMDNIYEDGGDMNI